MRNHIAICATVLICAMTSGVAFAGGVQVDDKSLTDILVAKGVLSKDEAKIIKHNNEGKLKFEAEVFANTTSKKVESATTTTNKTAGLAIDRAYLTGKFSFDDNWMMRITTDVNLDTALTKKNNNIFLKYAYLQGKLYGDALVLRLGQSHTPWIDHEEHLWGHRYVSPVFIDKHGFDNSSDLGIGLKGKLADGLVKYWVTETDGRGYSHPGLNTANTAGVQGFDFDSRIGIYPIKALTVDFQYRNGLKGTKYFDTVTNTTTIGNRSALYQAMVTYGIGHDYRVGTNYIHNKLRTTATGVDQKDDGYSLWGWANIANGFGAFGRYDYNKTTKTGTTIDQKDNRYVIGLEYKPVKHVSFSLVYDYDKLKEKGFVAGASQKTTIFGLYSNFKY